MSEFIEKIKRISNSFEAPIGFKKLQSEAMLSPMLIVKDVSNEVVKNLVSISTEADAAIINVTGMDSTNMAKFTGIKSNVPIGIQWDKKSSEEARSLINKDIDFVIFDLESKISGLNKEGLGKILKINKPLIPGMIKAINDLNMQIDCIMVDNDRGELDTEILLKCHLFTDMANKPLIINSPTPLTTAELVELSNANIRALILPPEASLEGMRQLRNDIVSLPKVKKNKAAKMPLIPKIRAMTMAEEVEEEDDDGDGLL